MSDPRFPIGKFTYTVPPTEQEREKYIQDIENAPAMFRAAVSGLNAKQLDTPYRDGGWTVRQLIHHMPDSHMNGYIRFRLALTEDHPTIKPYREELWAETSDNGVTPPEVSLALLEVLHQRWAKVLRSMKAEDWKRTFNHPDSGVITLERNLALYAWHGHHHSAHVNVLRKKMGWDN